MTQRFKEPPASLTKEAYMARFSGVFEHSDWIIEAAFDQGLGDAEATLEGFSRRLQGIVEAATEMQKLNLLRAHPELAGKLAMAQALTRRSNDEQAGAGLDQCSAAEYERFQVLNAAYRARFGFPFIIAVKGLTRADILQAFETRLAQPREAEVGEALAQVFKIARFRLAALVD